jgi:hypothetical protein
MPYWDRSVFPAEVDYTAITGGVWYDTDSKQSDAMFIVGYYQWLNAANPDWKNLINDDPKAFNGLTGEGYYPLRDIASISITVDESQAKIDKWWGSANIGKYGVVSPSVIDQVVQPMTFINHLHSMVIVPDENFTGFYYNLQPGVSISGLCGQYGHNIDSASKYPPVYWYTEGAVLSGMYNLMPNQSPFSVFGPEILP